MNHLNNFLQKLLERSTGHVLRYRIIFCVCVVIHIFFMILFAYIGLKEMVYFNILSILLYAAGFIFAKSTKKTSLWIILMYMEIVMHAVLSNFYLDWSYGFSLYSLMVIPLSYYLAYLHPKIKKPNVFSRVLAIINIILITATGFLSPGQITEFDIDLSKFIAFFNFVVSAFVITIFSSIYIYEIRTTLGDLSSKNNELAYLANYDPLTNLRNRHHIVDVFEDYEQVTKPFSVILGDIDDFKRINDTYSHDCGDKVLVTVSNIIRKHVDEKGVVCRWGGEEILIILSGKIEGSLDLMEKIRLEIQNQRMSFGIKQINVTMTFGFADYSEAMNIEKLVSIADKRLYTGKRNGKNQIVYK